MAASTARRRKSVGKSLVPFLLLLLTVQAHKKKKPNEMISLAESMEISRKSLKDPQVQSARREYWKKTLDEIRSVSSRAIASPDREHKSTLTRWKSLSEPSKSTNATGSDGYSSSKRFEGYRNWERTLQDWGDDIQEYLDAWSEETGEPYSFSNYGRSLTSDTDQTATPETNVTLLKPSIEVEESTIPKTPHVSQKGTLSRASVVPAITKSVLPIPAPVKPGETVLPHTDISDKSKRILIVTTASLPWRTGTAVNPLLRAAYLTEGRKVGGGKVTLMLPWLERRVDQEVIYGKENVFASPEEQENYIRKWLRESAQLPDASEELNIRWYTAWQNPAENSIYSMGDITALIPADEVDICILEEPEHLNWYRAPGESWTKKYKHVVGILHTNYFQYALDQPAAFIRAPAMRLLCSWMCRAHCHRIVKLSGTLDQVAPEKELVENVHGVRGDFLDVAEQLRPQLEKPNTMTDPVFSPSAQPTVYFIGKMLWSKGLGSLMELLKYAEESADLTVNVDMYGGGPDKDQASSKAKSLGLDMPFHGPIDHVELGSTHKIFVNPSTSEVLCTTSAEALAMGKFVILPSHPSNDFFAQFPNCLPYTSKEEFVGNLYYAMTHSPEPLTDEYSFALSWKAATQRLEAAVAIPELEYELMMEALQSDDAGVDFSVPPLVDDKKGRKAIATTLKYSRHRFRQFRSRLSTEIEQNKVLPKTMRDRLVHELDKRLDLDLEEILESPKLRLKLSPAELDKSLLELYDKASEGPGGDLIRVIGGGGQVGMQKLYMRRRSLEQRRRNGKTPDIFPSVFEDAFLDSEDKSPTERVRWALKRNLPSQSKQGSSRSDTDDKVKPSMAFQPLHWRTPTHVHSLPSGAFVHPPRRSNTFSLLI